MIDEKFNKLMETIEPVKPVFYPSKDVEYFLTFNNIFYKYEFEEMKSGQEISKLEEDGKYNVLVVIAHGKMFSIVTRQVYDSSEECEAVYQDVLRREKFESWVVYE